MKRIYIKSVKGALLSTFIVFYSMVNFGATYYVNKIGNNSNSGLTPVLAWKTIAKVNITRFQAGDHILFNKGDTWEETLVIPSSGSYDNPIIFGSFGTGNMPIITGSNKRAYTINTNNKIHITIDGLNLNHALGSNLEGSVNVGSDTVQGIVIKNCLIEYNRRCGIALRGALSATSVTIDHCVIQNNGQFGILILNSYDTGQISNCQFISNGWASLTDRAQISGIQGNLGNFDIFGNSIFNSSPTAIANNQSHGIYFSTSTIFPANIHNNIIYGNQKGAGIKIRFSANIYNNIIYSNNISCINLGGNGNFKAVYNIHNNILYGSVSGFSGIYEGDKGLGAIILYVNNNTFYKSGNAYKSTKELSIFDNLTVLMIQNNIFYAANGHGGVNIVNQSNAIIDYNLYWKDSERGEPNNIYNGTTYRTLEKWKAIGFDTHGVNSNPRLNNPTSDFQIESNSPAINVGVNVGLTKDFNGNPIVENPDIGAFESANPTDI